MIEYVTGDATQPIGTGPRIITHCCNNAGCWGRGGDDWISVADRPPAPGHKVLVCYDETVSEGYLGRYGRWYDASNHEIPRPDVWRPLPPPPARQRDTAED